MIDVNMQYIISRERIAHMTKFLGQPVVFVVGVVGLPEYHQREKNCLIYDSRKPDVIAYENSDVDYRNCHCTVNKVTGVMQVTIEQLCAVADTVWPVAFERARQRVLDELTTKYLWKEHSIVRRGA